MSGGAINMADVQAEISDSCFLLCMAGAGGTGGAINLYNGAATSALTVTRTEFWGCAAPGTSGNTGMGGAIYALRHNLSVFASDFIGNSADMGGAIHFYSDTSARGLVLFDDCFEENKAGSGITQDGAALSIQQSFATVDIRNCTITQNTSGAAIYNAGGTIRIDNSIVWNESSDDLLNTAGTLTVTYSCIEDSGDTGTGVIHDEPEFTNEDAPFRLSPTSPCIDAADDAKAPAFDHDGISHFPDPDMGAWERDPQVDRAAGANRYATAVEASKEHFAHAEKVVLATGASYPDALSAAPLAGIYGAPILLTPTDSLPTVVKDELVRLETEEIFIIGGTGAVSSAVQSELENLGYRTERIAGANRYATSQAVVQKMADIRGTALGSHFLVARGDAFPDALSVSPCAYNNAVPILLTPPNALPSGFASKVSALGFNDAVIVGGTGAVSTKVESDIDALIAGKPRRVGGADRYATAVEFARYVKIYSPWADPQSVDFLGLATGANFPDALCGGTVCGYEGGQLLLTRTNALPSSVELYVTDHSDTLAYVQAFGGTAVVNDSVLTEVDNLIP